MMAFRGTKTCESRFAAQTWLNNFYASYMRRESPHAVTTENADGTVTITWSVSETMGD